MVTRRAVAGLLLIFSLITSVDASSEMWSRTYGGEHGKVVYTFDIAYSLVETSDGGYALAGYTRNANIDVIEGWLVKTDAKGDVVWNLTYGEGIFRSLVETSDGGYALATGEGLVKTDENGNMEWNQTYGGDDYDCFHALIETSDGGYALAGETYSFSAGASDFWLVKTDEYGVIPEFPSWLILPLFLMATLSAIIVKKRLFRPHP